MTRRWNALTPEEKRTLAKRLADEQTPLAGGLRAEHHPADEHHGRRTEIILESQGRFGLEATALYIHDDDRGTIIDDVNDHYGTIILKAYEEPQ